jgi:hypothetical protein
MRVSTNCGRSIWILLSYRTMVYPQIVYSLCAEMIKHFSGNNSCQASNSQDPQALSTVATDIPLGFQSVHIDADIDTVNKISAAIIYAAPSNYVGAVAILVNCSDHDHFGYDNNVFVHDQIELSVEKLQQDPLVSFRFLHVEFSSVDFVSVEKILGQQLFSGLQIDNDVSVEEIVSCTITTRAVLGSDNLTFYFLGNSIHRF